MRVLFIGDVHGSDCWIDIINNNTFDRCVFLGDFFDSFEVPIDKQIDVFDSFINTSDKVISVIGNHDIHYLYSRAKCSGYSHITDLYANKMLHDAVLSGKIVGAVLIGDVLVTHAGVTKTWCANNDIDHNNPHEVTSSINEMLLDGNRVHRLFKNHKCSSPHGNCKLEGPLWVRPESLIKDRINNVTQIVGHTQLKNVTFRDGIYFIDALPNYLILEI